MKQSGLCPKCKSDNVYISNSDSLYLERRTIYLRGWGNDLQVAVYLCVDCGYLEEYVNHISEKTRGQLKKNWRKVKFLEQPQPETIRKSQATWDEVEVLLEKINGKKSSRRNRED